MAENKTRATKKSVHEFLDSIDDEQKRSDCLVLAEVMEQTTGSPPVMWGESIVGFGNYHYKYASGREGDWFLAGFSPRKQNITIYVMCYLEHLARQLDGLGKYKHGKGCIYIKKLHDIDIKVLKNLIRHSIKHLQDG